MLVVAAVILLIVFLAVPALQRNSRNNQRLQDIARLGAAYTEYLNNGGEYPTGAISTNLALGSELYAAANIQTFASVQITEYTGSITSGPNPIDSRVQLRTRSVCNEQKTDVEEVANPGRTAMAFWIEAADGGFATRCQQIR